MTDHEDEMSQEERWRTQLQKKVNSRFLEIERMLKNTLSTVRETKRACSEVRQQQAFDSEKMKETLLELKGILAPETAPGSTMNSPRDRKKLKPGYFKGVYH